MPFQRAGSPPPRRLPRGRLAPPPADRPALPQSGVASGRRGGGARAVPPFQVSPEQLARLAQLGWGRSGLDAGEAVLGQVDPQPRRVGSVVAGRCDLGDGPSLCPTIRVSGASTRHCG